MSMQMFHSEPRQTLKVPFKKPIIGLWGVNKKFRKCYGQMQIRYFIICIAIVYTVGEWEATYPVFLAPAEDQQGFVLSISLEAVMVSYATATALDHNR